MALKDILTLVSAILGFVTATLIPTIIVLIKQIKRAKQAKCDALKAKTEEEKQRAEAEKQAAINDITELMKGFCADTESYFKAYESEVKAKGGSCAAAKQDSVLTKVLKECITRGIDYDQQYWAKKVDDYVASTKVVNAKQ